MRLLKVPLAHLFRERRRQDADAEPTGMCLQAVPGTGVQEKPRGQQLVQLFGEAEVGLDFDLLGA